MNQKNKSLGIIEYDYPFADKSNVIFSDLIKSRPHDNSVPSTVHAKMTSWDLNIDNLWVTKLIEFVITKIQNDFGPFNGNLKCSGCWGVIHDEDHHILPHHHYPDGDYSFTYYVNVPEGSSPLVFYTSKLVTLNPYAGKLVIFTSKIIHEVPKNKCMNRICIAGDISLETK